MKDKLEEMAASKSFSNIMWALKLPLRKVFVEINAGQWWRAPHQFSEHVYNECMAFKYLHSKTWLVHCSYLLIHAEIFAGFPFPSYHIIPFLTYHRLASTPQFIQSFSCSRRNIKDLSNRAKFTKKVKKISLWIFSIFHGSNSFSSEKNHQ